MGEDYYRFTAPQYARFLAYSSARIGQVWWRLLIDGFGTTRTKHPNEEFWRQGAWSSMVFGLHFWSMRIVAFDRPDPDRINEAEPFHIRAGLIYKKPVMPIRMVDYYVQNETIKGVELEGVEEIYVDKVETRSTAEIEQGGGNYHYMENKFLDEWAALTAKHCLGI